jgi:hypothetical protein
VRARVCRGARSVSKQGRACGLAEVTSGVISNMPCPVIARAVSRFGDESARTVTGGVAVSAQDERVLPRALDIRQRCGGARGSCVRTVMTWQTCPMTICHEPTPAARSRN